MVDENQLKEDFTALKNHYDKIRKCRTQNKEEEEKKQRVLDKISGEIERIKKALALKQKISKSTTDQRAELLGAFFGDEFQKGIKTSKSGDIGFASDFAPPGFAIPLKKTAEPNKKNLIKKKAKKKEYENMVVFSGFLPENSEKIINYDGKKLEMRKIEGTLLKDISPSKLKKNTGLIEELGRIVAVMHNHGFVHGNFDYNSIILDKNKTWKLTGFEKSKYYAGKKSKELVDNQTYDLELLHINLSKFNSHIVNEFYRTYLLRRNFLEDASFFIEGKNSDAVKSFFGLLRYVEKNITEQSTAEKNLIAELLEQFEEGLPNYSNDIKIIFGDFKKELLEIKEQQTAPKKDGFLKRIFSKETTKSSPEKEQIEPIKPKMDSDDLGYDREEVEKLLFERTNIIEAIKKDKEKLAELE